MSDGNGSDETVFEPTPEGGSPDPSTDGAEDQDGGLKWSEDPKVLGAIGAAVLVLLLIVGVLAFSGDDGDNASSNRATTTSLDETSDGEGSDAEQTAIGEVESWQRALNAVGCNAGAVDGQIGTASFDAMSRFQFASGFPDDGAFTPDTIEALLQAEADGRTVCTADNGRPNSGGGDDCFDGPECGDGGGQAEIDSAIHEIARGQYVSTASTCPTEGGFTTIDDANVSTDVFNLADYNSGSTSVLEGVTSAPSFGDQTWTYDVGNDEWNWNNFFCDGYSGG